MVLFIRELFAAFLTKALLEIQTAAVLMNTRRAVVAFLPREEVE